jgi:hypothetical protein
MAHFANIVQGIVEQVIVIDNQYENDGNTYINEVLNLSGTWIQTSYNNNIRANYAGIGYTYDEVNDVFYSPEPFVSWILNEETWKWEAPIPYPEDGEYYDWNEEQLNWEIL